MAALKVAVVGTGRGGFALAADLALQGHDVVLCAGDRPAEIEPVRARGGIQAAGALGERLVPVRLEDEVGPAVADADLVAVPVPGSVQERYLRLILPHLRSGQALWLCQGGGATLLPAARERAGDVLLIETMYIPYSARRTAPGRIDVRARLRVPYAAFPGRRTGEAGRLLGRCFDLPPATSVLEIALQNVNAIIHPLPCLLNWGDIERSGHAFAVTRDGMSEPVLRAMEALDGERVAVCRAAGVSDLSVDGIYALLGASVPPYRRPPGTGVGEEYEDRFILEAVPIGLVTIASLAGALGVPAPLARSTIALCDALYGVDSWRDGRTLRTVGLADLSPTAIRDVLERGGP